MAAKENIARDRETWRRRRNRDPDLDLALLFLLAFRPLP
jgi:hypothetical protein